VASAIAARRAASALVPSSAVPPRRDISIPHQDDANTRRVSGVTANGCVPLHPSQPPK
jgi:hypothetical protein